MDKKEFKFGINRSVFLLNNEEIKMNSFTVLNGSQTLIPLETLKYVVDGEVSWDQNSNAIYIFTQKF